MLRWFIASNLHDILRNELNYESQINIQHLLCSLNAQH